jgi:indoleamine 2,3-dioxygenase
VQRLPPAVSIPLLAAASQLEVQPAAGYAALNLWNWAPRFEGADLTQPDNLRALITFTGTEDESWFFMVSNAMEARAAPVITAMLSALEAIEADDSEVVIASLQFLSKSLGEIGILLERMDERCDPQVFYHQIRPFVAGSLNDHLPKGVMYDEGDGQGSWRKYRGGSNGQSSLIQFFDAILGVVHEKTIGFHEVR